MTAIPLGTVKGRTRSAMRSLADSLAAFGATHTPPTHSVTAHGVPVRS
jgi:hypothetical protein